MMVAAMIAAMVIFMICPFSGTTVLLECHVDGTGQPDKHGLATLVPDEGVWDHISLIDK